MVESEPAKQTVSTDYSMGKESVEASIDATEDMSRRDGELAIYAFLFRNYGIRFSITLCVLLVLCVTMLEIPGKCQFRTHMVSR